jgi:hypothetical protein
VIKQGARAGLFLHARAVSELMPQCRMLSSPRLTLFHVSVMVPASGVQSL